MHAESGYWRPTFEVVIAQSTGLVEVHVNILIMTSDYLFSCIKGLAVHAGGPFQQKDKCRVLEAAIRAKLRTSYNSFAAWPKYMIGELQKNRDLQKNGDVKKTAVFQKTNKRRKSEFVTTDQHIKQTRRSRKINT